MNQQIITKVKLANLSCPACQKVTEKKISQISGVEEVHVDLGQSLATIGASRAITLEEVTKTLEGTHYQVVSIIS